MLSMFVSVGLTVSAADLSRISVSQNPNKVYYIVGETFNIDGLKVMGIYGTKEKVISNKDLKFKSGIEFAPGYKFTVAGNKNIEVTYKEKRTSFNITVLNASAAKNILLNANGGGKNKKYVVDPKSSHPLPVVSFAKKGYSLIGWSTVKKPKANQIMSTDAAINTVKYKSKGTTTLYA